MITARSYGKALSKEAAYAEDAKVFSGKVRDLGVFLAQRLEATGIPLGDPDMGRIAFHDHCQSVHGLGTRAEPRSVLARLQGADVVELPRADHCCGAGGAYMLRYPVRSAAIRADKLQAIEEAGADTVVAGNPGCLMNMEAGLREAGTHARPRHMAEVIWKAICRGTGK